MRSLGGGRGAPTVAVDVPEPKLLMDTLLIGLLVKEDEESGSISEFMVEIASRDGSGKAGL